MNTKVIIPYVENKTIHIIKAMNIFQAFTDISRESLDEMVPNYRLEKDFSYDVDNENLDDILFSLKREGFFYRLEKLE